MRSKSLPLPISFSRPPRRGFTLVELMMVITIIALLMTLVISVVGSFITHARDSATRATIEKIESLLNARSQAFNRLIMRKGFLQGTPEFQAVSVNMSALPQSTQKIIAIKFLEMKYFPQRPQDFNELMGLFQANPPTQLQLAALYPNLFNGVAPKGNVTVAGENSEYLYDFLTQENVLGDSPEGRDSFSAAEVQDKNGNGFPEFLDGWGNPIRFYRWPTRLFRSGGTGAAISNQDVNNAKVLFASLPVFSGNLAVDLARDPDDPLQECLSPVLNGGAINFESLFHTPATYHVLLIVSAGPDGVLGLYEPDDPNASTTYGNLAAVKDQNALIDDIVYLNIRAGGK